MAKPTPMPKQFAGNYEQKRLDCFLYTARELTGRAKQRELSAKGKTLDWEKFNAHFEKAYANYTADEMLAEILNNVWWLADEASVIDLYFRYISDAQKNANNGKQKQNEQDDDEFSK